MRRTNGLPMNAQQKMIAVNDKFGNTGIKSQQGTSRILYDALPLNPSLDPFTLTFFENVKTRKFPFTNLPENKLQVGETFTIEDYYMSLIAVVSTPLNPNQQVIVEEAPFERYKNTRGLYRADLDFMIGENRVIKQLKVGSSYSSFNYGANFLTASTKTSRVVPDPLPPVGSSDITNQIQLDGHDVYPLRTALVIPPDIEFIAPVKFSGLIALPTELAPQIVTWYVMLTIEGRASILAPRTTF